MERGLRVLIADDRQTTRRGLKALLALLPQVEVVGEASNGRDAVNLVAESRPDVVLTDIKMPVMDGVEATRHIKERWPDVKVVVLTMYAGYRAEVLAAGADAFLLKDEEPEVLLAAILDRVRNSPDNGLGHSGQATRTNSITGNRREGSSI